LIDAYLDALARELSLLKGPHEVDTLFFGGGTPTHLASAQFERLLEIVCRTFVLAAGAEFSIEANPADLARTGSGAFFGQRLSNESADRPKKAPDPFAVVTRVSLGAQSFDSRKLEILERDHDAVVIEEACIAARQFAQSVSLDLIFGVPGETLETWRRDLDLALALAPDHVSTYGLTFEKGTAFWSRLAHGELARVDEDAERQMYELAIDTLTAAGFEHYEVSNFARPGHRCRHNEAYWTGKPYFAAGPGAARFVGGRREINHRSTTTYIRRVLAGLSPAAEFEELGPEDSARERLVFALRRLEGIDVAAFAAETGISVETLGGDALTRLVDRGLLDLSSGRLKLTRSGLLISDAIWPQFLRV
jgi:oxygen-independent coproporphyrinogen-3 oxidase